MPGQNRHSFFTVFGLDQLLSAAASAIFTCQRKKWQMSLKHRIEISQKLLNVDDPPAPLPSNISVLPQFLQLRIYAACSEKKGNVPAAYLCSVESCVFLWCVFFAKLATVRIQSSSIQQDWATGFRLDWENSRICDMEWNFGRTLKSLYVGQARNFLLARSSWFIWYSPSTRTWRAPCSVNRSPSLRWLCKKDIKVSPLQTSIFNSVSNGLSSKKALRKESKTETWKPLPW